MRESCRNLWFRKHFDSSVFLQFVVSYSLLFFISISILLLFMAPLTLRTAKEVDEAYCQTLLRRTQLYMNDVFDNINSIKYKIEHTSWFNSLYFKVIASGDALTVAEKDTIQNDLTYLSLQVPEVSMVSIMLYGQDTLYNRATITDNWRSLQKYDTTNDLKYQFFPLYAEEEGLSIQLYGVDNQYTTLVYRCRITNLLRASFNRIKGELNVMLNSGYISSKLSPMMADEAVALRVMSKSGHVVFSYLCDHDSPSQVITYRSDSSSPTYYYELDILTDVSSQNQQNMHKVLLITAVVDVLLSLLMALLFSWRNYQPIRKLADLLSSSNKHTSQSEFTLLGQGIRLLMHEKDVAQNKLEETRPLLRQHYIISLLSGSPGNPANIPDSLIKFRYPYFRVAAVHIPFSKCAPSPAESVEEWSIQANLAFEAAVLCLSEALPVEVFMYAPLLDQYILLINYQFEQAVEQYVESLINDCEKFLLKDRTSYCPYFGVSDATDSISNLYMYTHHAHLAQSTCVLNSGIVTWFDDLPRETVPNYRYTISDEILLINSIRSGNTQAAIEQIQHIFSENTGLSCMDWSSFCCLYYDLLSTFLKALHTTNLNPAKFITFQQNADFTSLSEMLHYFEDTVRRISNAICCLRQQDEKISTEDKILHYVLSNMYNSSLSLSDIAVAFNVSMSCVSTLFKTATGTTYSEYINRARINKALELLESTDLPIEDVVSQTGYVSLSTFRRNFIKYVGASPGSFLRSGK